MSKLLIIEQKYIRQIIDEGIASPVSLEIGKKFNDYISSKYSWEFTGIRIDWRKNSCDKRFNWRENSDEDTALFLQNTCLSNFSETFVFYGVNQPGLKVSFEYAKENLDVLMCHGFGTRFLVAIEDSEHNYNTKLIYDCFIEVDKNTWLTSSIVEENC